MKHTLHNKHEASNDQAIHNVQEKKTFSYLTYLDILCSFHIVSTINSTKHLSSIQWMLALLGIKKVGSGFI